MTTSVASVGIVGLGLIGSSLALALRDAGFAQRILGWDPGEGVLQQATDLNVVDTACGGLKELAGAVDLLVIATPTRVAESILGELLELAAGGGAAPWLTDVASVKGTLCRRAEQAPPAIAARFVPGHPIAGSERSGVAAADQTLFAAHRTILTPLPCTDLEGVVLIRAMWEAAGAEVVELPVDEHDAVLAATSHLPHAVAFALVNALAKSERSSDIFRFAAGGFRDFTRIASSDPVMWRDIFVANGPALLRAIDAFSAQLGELRGAVAQGDADALQESFQAAKTARDDFAAELLARQHRKASAESGTKSDTNTGASAGKRD